MAIRSRMPVTGGRSWTILPPERNVRWTSGCARAIREKVSATCPASVVSDLRNVRRTGMLIEEVANLHHGADRAAAGLDRPGDPGLDQDLRALGRVGLPGLAADLGDLGDRRQRLAAKAQGPDPIQVLDVGQLAGRVGLKRQRAGRRRPSPTPLSAIRTRSFPPRSTLTSTRVAPGVDGVLEQLLDHARRPLDHLARGDLVDHRIAATGGSLPSHKTSLGRTELLPLILPADLAYRKRRVQSQHRIGFVRSAKYEPIGRKIIVCMDLKPVL